VVAVSLMARLSASTREDVGPLRGVIRISYLDPDLLAAALARHTGYRPSTATTHAVPSTEIALEYESRTRWRIERRTKTSSWTEIRNGDRRWITDSRGRWESHVRTGGRPIWGSDSGIADELIELMLHPTPLWRAYEIAETTVPHEPIHSVHPRTGECWPLVLRSQAGSYSQLLWPGADEVGVCFFEAGGVLLWTMAILNSREYAHSSWEHLAFADPMPNERFWPPVDRPVKTVRI
jgi:hypothetical protein